MNSLQKVKFLIKNNAHMVIATANSSAKPWVSPVFFMYDENYNLYWVSAKNAIHSQNIRKNSCVAIVILGSGPNGELTEFILTQKQQSLKMQKQEVMLLK